MLTTETNKTNLEVNSRSGLGITTPKEACSRCKEKSFPEGLYFIGVLNQIPLRIKLFFFTVTLDLQVRISYCPKCGHLSVGVSKL